MLLFLVFPGKKVIMVLLLSELLSCMLDQNRWQPWEYQFLFMAAVYVFIKGGKDILYSFQLIIAGLYFFSGLSKWNSAFIHDVWQNLLLHRWLGIYHVNSMVIRSGYALPLIEMLVGIGLLFNRTRKPAVLVLIIMHLLILCILGPVGLNMNIVVWPWNILMPALLYLLFYKEQFQFIPLHLLKRFSWLVILCWWILPWLQLGGYWDKYLSSVLYSGGVEQLFICTDDSATKNEMRIYMEKEFRVIPCSPVLSVYKWGVTEMNTSPYPERRIYNAIIMAWKKEHPNNTDRFYIYKPGFAYTVREVDTGYRIQDAR